MNRNLSLKIGAILILGLFVTVFAGCSGSPTGPSVPSNDGPRLLTRTSSSMTALMGASLFLEQVIPASTGGRIELFDVVLDIPAGAVRNDTLFSIGIPDPSVFYNVFGTHGLVFDRPVTVTMSYRDADLTGVNESSLRIAYYNEKTGTFEAVNGVVDTNLKVVKAQLYHFSAYGLISD